jgi:hypothetical protein
VVILVVHAAARITTEFALALPWHCLDTALALVCGVVPGLVTRRVLEALEVVQVRKPGRYPVVLTTLGPPYSLTEAVDEEVTVRKSG